jgi:hypothetical protein
VEVEMDRAGVCRVRGLATKQQQGRSPEPGAAPQSPRRQHRAVGQPGVLASFPLNDWQGFD